MQPQRESREAKKTIRFLQMLMNDKARIDQFNMYQPAVILLFVFGFALMSVASIYGAVRLQSGTDRDVILGTNFTGWALFVFTIIFYGVSFAPPMKPTSMQGNYYNSD